MAIPIIPFGRLGYMTARTIFGASTIEAVSQAEADRALDLLLEYGVNHIDVSPTDGDAELRLAPWFKRVPGHFTVGTKTTKRTAPEAREELHRSLERMGLDRVDLWQFQNLADPKEWETTFGPGGALEAALQAKKEGLIGGIGVTGHGAQIAAMHRKSLEHFDFDSVLAPYNYIMMVGGDYAENFNAMYALCQARNAAVLTMKTIALAPWRDREHTHATWYKPLEKQEDIDAAVWWTLAKPGVFLATASDLSLLPMVLDAANRFSSSIAQSQLDGHLSRLSMSPLFAGLPRS